MHCINITQNTNIEKVQQVFGVGKGSRNQEKLHKTGNNGDGL